MDFALDTTGTAPAMTFDRAADIRNNIILTLGITRGGWWFNPDFGLRPLSRLKSTPRTLNLVRAYIAEALQWLLDTGRATALDIDLQRDANPVTGRLAAVITVTQADGVIVTYSTFIEVA